MALLLFVVIVLFVVFYRVKRTLRTFSREAFGTDSLMEGLKQQEEILAETPKSVKGMTRIYLPQIMADFPEFSLPEFVQKSENLLKAALNAVETENTDLLQQASADLKEQVRIRIEDNRQQNIREYYQDIRIRQTEISHYQKQAGSCVITLQSAVGYLYYKGSKNPDAGGLRPRQTRYNLYLMYIQDEILIPENGRAVSVVCPQCGAPVTNLGSKTCEYCQSAVEPVNIRSWFLTRIQEE